MTTRPDINAPTFSGQERESLAAIADMIIPASEAI